MTQTKLESLFIGHSAAIVELREIIRRAARSPAPVLIQGPTGCGKELVAHGLHAESGRRGHFVPFNAAAIPETLFESELFGHVRGAFSGAIRDRPGLLRRAANGTAFMDEVGELPATAQAKLLRVLDTREVWPVGADFGQRTDFRLVAATNLDLGTAVQHGRFRADLLFRLRGILITVPPLSARPDDISLLAAHFARAAAAGAGITDIVFTQRAMERLTQHSWPGNVRELRQAVGYAAFLADAPVIREQHVVNALHDSTVAMSTGPDPEERQQLQELLRTHAGDVSAVAKALGVDRSTAYRRMHRLGVSVSPRGARRRPAPDAAHAKIGATAAEY